MIDVSWFKKKQKEAGVTSDQIADLVGRARSNISHIYAGRQKMSLDWAQAFATSLNQPLDEILRRAGAVDAQGNPVITESSLETIRQGFSESDAEPYRASPAAMSTTNKIAALFGQRPGVDVWTINTEAMRLGGYLPGDKILLDTHKSEITRAGDVVIAQIYNWQSGEVKTVLRRHEPPVLIADSLVEEDRRVLVVDGNNVVIKGKVVAQWRS
ncbi:helix-turn-helix transcriptional regulator [Roseobacter sp. TSBP12]|uniref:helix-turn-helix transcriptional regulator n=1 Tax=Roseobacter sp. TSBP12 TaxID=1236613 RepID=UPI00186AB33F|nr:helix-turn-helix transcriptional regulator [Roseobacter sp. TSBP12]KAB6717737.1 hypothetical protein C8029_04245 [Roseobacter sp. TSBP12]